MNALGNSVGWNRSLSPWDLPPCCQASPVISHHRQICSSVLEAAVHSPREHLLELDSHQLEISMERETSLSLALLSRRKFGVTFLATTTCRVYSHLVVQPSRRTKYKTPRNRDKRHVRETRGENKLHTHTHTHTHKQQNLEILEGQ